MPGMKLATAFQLAYGVLGAVGRFVLVRCPRWSWAAPLGWCVAVTAEGLLAPIVYAGRSIIPVVSAAIVAAIAGSAWWAWGCWPCRQVCSAGVSVIGVPSTLIPAGTGF